MVVETKKLIQLKGAVDTALEQARKVRNEEDRKYIVSNIGQDLVRILTPLLREIAQSSKMNATQIQNLISAIKVEAPQVNISPPNIEVKSPEVNVPEIKVKVPDIKIPPVRVPTPQVTVKAPVVKIPKEMEVKGLKGLIKSIGDALKQKPKIEFNQDKPMQVILTDNKGEPYKALTKIASSGGGRGVVTVQKATGSKIEQLLLEDVTKWYELTMPKSMVSLDMFLNLQGAKCYYRWDNEADETQPRMPIFPGYSRSIVNARFVNRKMYVTSPTANQTIVVEYFLE